MYSIQFVTLIYNAWHSCCLTRSNWISLRVLNYLEHESLDTASHGERAYDA
jgi:ammonia channel protein AmtB